MVWAVLYDYDDEDTEYGPVNLSMGPFPTAEEAEGAFRRAYPISDWRVSNVRVVEVVRSRPLIGYDAAAQAGREA